MVRVETPFSRSAGLTDNKDLKRMTNHSGLGLEPAHTIIIVQYQLLHISTAPRTRKVLKNINPVEPFYYKFLCLGLHQYFVRNVLITTLYFLKNPDLITLKYIQFIEAPCYDHVISFFWLTSFVLLYYLTMVLF